MESAANFKTFAILYVDDEEISLKYFAKTFEPQFRILTATNAADGFRLLQEHKDGIGLLMTDQRMPGEQGVQLLQRARELSPRTLRILVTGYADIEAAITAVNSGAIYKYITKPWQIPQLEMTLRHGLEYYTVQRERDQLLRDKLAMTQNLIMADRLACLGVLAAGLNHHLRNSLVAIRTFLDLTPSKLQEEKVDLERLRRPDFWTDFHIHVQTQVARVTEMLAEFGLTARRSNYAIEHEVSLADVISGAVEVLSDRLRKRRITLETAMPDSLPLLRVDKWKFQRLFELLLGGELLTAPEGSRIFVKARSVPSGGNSDWAIQLEIHDESAGLPTQALHSMFDPLRRSSVPEAEFGVGLLTCYFIVYHHGGRIEIRSGEGTGVSYLLTFPSNPLGAPLDQEDQTFLTKMLSQEALWEKLLAGK